MRISDWSSDVCSSDLLLQQCHEVDDLAGAFVRCRLGLDLGTDLRALALESRPDRTAKLLAEFILVLIRLETAAHRLDELACHRQFLVIDAEALEARSEEHTSELQSLMRNSYAVFCLKK